MSRKAIPEQRKEQLITAAFETIGDVGLAGVTLSQVASQAGMSTGIVSHYFGDKDGLLNATMRRILRDLHDAVAACRSPAAGHPKRSCSPLLKATFIPARPAEHRCVPGLISGQPACISPRFAACNASTITDFFPIFAANSAAIAA